MTTITQVITALPTAPDPATMSPSLFASTAAASVLAQKAMTPELNLMAGQMNTVAGEINAAIAPVAGQVAAVAASEANTAAFANFKGAWSALTGALAKPASVFHNGAFWTLLNNLADVTASTPGVSADWQVCGGAWPIVPISTNTTAVPWRTYMFTAACTLTAPAISGNGKQFGIVVLPGVTGAIFAPAGADKTRGASGSQPIDAPFTATLTDSGATHGWV